VCNQADGDSGAHQISLTDLAIKVSDLPKVTSIWRSVVGIEPATFLSHVRHLNHWVGYKQDWEYSNYKSHLTIHTDATTIEHSLLVHAHFEICDGLVEDAGFGMTIAATLFTCTSVFLGAWAPFMLIKHWTTSLTWITTCVVFTFTFHILKVVAYYMRWAWGFPLRTRKEYPLF
jgi:hypothetical protein